MYTHIPILSILKSNVIFITQASPPNREEILAHEMLMLVWNEGISSIKRDPFNTPAIHALYLSVKWWKKVTKKSHLFRSPLEPEKQQLSSTHFKIMSSMLPNTHFNSNQWMKISCCHLSTIMVCSDIVGVHTIELHTYLKVTAAVVANSLGVVYRVVGKY